MTTPVRIGFIPLVDAALLVAARDEGFAEEEGLVFDLVREVSWANIRDKLNVGLFDAAHNLAPATIASTLGLGHLRVPLVVPIGLNLNGNAITVSRAIYLALGRAADGDLGDPAVSARALARVIADRAAAGEPPLTFACTFPFSTHHYQLRIWMRAGGIDPDEQVRLVVIPPPLMAPSLESGHVDGFCVGAPWNALTIAAGDAAILHRGIDIVSDCPEKVLSLRARIAEERPDLVAALVRTVLRAADWCSTPANHPILARHLAREAVLGVPAPIIERILAGALPLGLDGPARPEPVYIRFDVAAIRPEAAHVDFLLDEMARAGQVAAGAAERTLAHTVYRRDFFDAAAPASPPVPPPVPLAG
jgi:ABC-type nitrate/sulfonate/bicarbonate transport system substrate-binding protein